MSVYIFGTLDTKGIETLFVRDALVELGVEMGELLGCARLRRGVAAPQRVLQQGHDRGIVAAGGEAGVQRFQERAHLDQLGHQFGRDGGDGGAAPRLQPHQAFHGQAEQGLEQRPARHAELERQPVFDQPLAGLESAVEDLAADLVAHDLAEGSAIDGHGAISSSRP